MKRFVATLLVLCGLLVAGWANAAATITFNQVGNDVQAQISGNINLSGLTFNGTGNFSSEVIPSIAVILIGESTNNISVDSYTILPGGPASFGPGNFQSNPNSGTSNIIFGVGSGTQLYVTSGFTGGVVSGTSTWNNSSFVSLGLTPGAYTYSWGVDSLTVQIGPPSPPTPAPTPSAVPTLSEWSQMLLGLLVMTLLGWHFHKQRSY